MNLSTHGQDVPHISHMMPIRISLTTHPSCQIVVIGPNSSSVPLMKRVIVTTFRPYCPDRVPGLLYVSYCFLSVLLPHAIFTLLHVSSFPSAVRSRQRIVDMLFVMLFIVVPS
jgi:hypothetical protein